MNYLLLLEIFNFKEIINQNELRDMICNFISDQDLITYLNTLNYRSFDHIQTELDIENIKLQDIINFIVDNRYGFVKIFNKKNTYNNYNFQLTNLIKIDNIKSWINVLKLIELSQKHEEIKKMITF